MAARVLALLLVFSFAPGATELIEHAVHFVAYGDAADQVDDAHETSRPLGDREHGCSGGFHLGACSTGQPTALTSTIVVAAISLCSTPAPLPRPATLRGCAAAAPELRPPIA